MHANLRSVRPCAHSFSLLCLLSFFCFMLPFTSKISFVQYKGGTKWVHLPKLFNIESYRGHKLRNHSQNLLIREHVLLIVTPFYLKLWPFSFSIHALKTSVVLLLCVVMRHMSAFMRRDNLQDKWVLFKIGKPLQTLGLSLATQNRTQSNCLCLYNSVSSHRCVSSRI